MQLCSVAASWACMLVRLHPRQASFSVAVSKPHALHINFSAAVQPFAAMRRDKGWMWAFASAPHAGERRVDDQGLADEVLARLLRGRGAGNIRVEGALDGDEGFVM